MMRMKLGLILAAVLLAAPVMATADPFKDLPGVKLPQAEGTPEPQMNCTSQLERQQATRNRNGLAYRTYSCDLGRVRMGSSEPPNEIEYKKSRDHYQQ